MKRVVSGQWSVVSGQWSVKAAYKANITIKGMFSFVPNEANQANG
jgi:hypothetical protein